uniref:Interleukin-18 receptor 1-like n=1 Tax=Scophthalmus maximus TaxID=52904 RepID=A0A8D3AP66_SCOMX
MRGVITMMVKMLLLPLLSLLMLLPGVFPLRAGEIHSKAGEMVTLWCPGYTSFHRGDAKLVWTSHTAQRTYVTNNMSSAELTQMGVLVHGGSLVIPSVSVHHQGNYSCSVGNASNQFWLTLTVNTAQSREYEERTKYSKTCYTQQSCKLTCPDLDSPDVNTPNITSNGITWHKEGEPLPNVDFPSVEEKHGGVYTCTRSYLYHGQMYNMTYTVALDVKPKKIEKTAVIISPRNADVFNVDLGSTLTIECKAVAYSDFDKLYWLSGKSIVEKNANLTVFSSDKRKVSEEDLAKNYTCKLGSVSQKTSFVTIILQKARHLRMPLALSTVGIVLVMTVTVVAYVKLKIHITLFLRDTLGCHRSTADGKSYDAFLMCYKSNADAGLSDRDRKWLESVLEERFGYSLCLYDRNVLPGKPVADAVLDCIEESRTVVLVPVSSDPGLGSSLLSAIHAALVERQTRLIFIKTETTEVSTTGSLPEALQLVSEAGDCVTWKGVSSMPPSSAFWKRLCYYLPASRQAPKLRHQPQTI